MSDTHFCLQTYFIMLFHFTNFNIQFETEEHTHGVNSLSYASDIGVTHQQDLKNTPIQHADICVVDGHCF